jgi:hypothetical protein
MRIQYLAAALAGVLFLSSLATGGLCLWYVWSYRQNMVVQTEVMRLNLIGGAVRSLLGDSVEYGRRNPSITPLLQQFNLMPRGSATNLPPGGTGSTRPSSK